MTEKELISKLQNLKQIKPKAEWVSLTRNEIFGGVKIQPKRNSVGVFQYLDYLFFQKKLAYAFAAFVLIFAGFIGFVKYGVPQNNPTPIAPVAMSSALKSDVENFKVKSQTYAQAVKSSKDIGLAANEVKSAVQNLTNEIKKDPTVAKQVALDVNNNKTYLDVPGSNEMKDTSNDLYKAIDQQMIIDFQKTTLTEDQKKTLAYINDLFKQGKYDAALENILLMNVATNNGGK